MREIKFRAWLPNECKMTRTHTLEDMVSMCALGYPESAHWLQFTGLKDKNGIEIYEGDVVKFPTLYETPEMCSTEYDTEQVLFVDGAFYLEDKSGKYLHENTLACEMNAYDDNFEVIGNIYQPPHLLTKAEKA